MVDGSTILGIGGKKQICQCHTAFFPHFPTSRDNLPPSVIGLSTQHNQCLNTKKKRKQENKTASAGIWLLWNPCNRHFEFFLVRLQVRMALCQRVHLHIVPTNLGCLCRAYLPILCKSMISSAKNNTWETTQGQALHPQLVTRRDQHQTFITTFRHAQRHQYRHATVKRKNLSRNCTSVLNNITEVSLTQLLPFSLLRCTSNSFLAFWFLLLPSISISENRG